MLTIRATPAARARSITAARSASNCGACRLTWLSRIMRGGDRLSGGPAEFPQGGEEGVGAVEVEGVDLARQALQRLPRVGPAIKRPDPLRGLVGRQAMHPVGQPLEQQLEVLRALPAA